MYLKLLKKQLMHKPAENTSKHSNNYTEFQALSYVWKNINWIVDQNIWIFFIDEVTGVDIKALSFDEKHLEIGRKILGKYVFWQRPPEVVSHIQELLLGLDEEWRFKVLEFIAMHDGRRAAEYFDLFMINTPKYSVQMANICSLKHARRTAKHISQFNINDEYDRYIIAMQCCLTNPQSVLEYLCNFDIINPIFIRAIIVKSILVNPGASIKMLHRIPEFWSLEKIQDYWNINSLNDWINQFIEEWGDTSSIQQSAKNLFKRVPRREMAIRVLSWYLLWSDICQSDWSAISILSWFSLTDESIKHLSDTTRNDLLELILDLQSRYNKPIGSWIRISKSLFESQGWIKQIIALLSALNLVSQARGVSCWENKSSMIRNINDWLQIQDRWYIDVDENNIDTIKTIVNETMFNEVVNVAAEISWLKLTGFDIEKLSEKIKDTTPIFVVLARYIWKPEWHDSIYYFIKLMQSIINWNSSDIKYWKILFNEETDSTLVDSQIGWLDPEQLAIWRRGSYRLDISEIKTKEVDQCEDEIKWLICNLHELLLKKLEWPLWLESTIASIAEFLSMKDKDIIKYVKESLRWNYDILLFSLIEKLQWNTDLNQLRKVLAKIKSLKDFFLTDLTIKDIIDSISSKINKLRPVDKDIIFTAEIDNPYSVFTITEMMWLSSCLNFSNGTELQALISYSIDSNVKLVASFVIKNSDFNNRRDYLEFIEMVENDWFTPKIKFDQWRYVIDYIVQWVQKSILLKNVAYRRFMKLWIDTQSKHPWIWLEPWMQQVYIWIEWVKKFANNLIQDKIVSMQLPTPDSITMPKSRSSLWSYSDINHGRHLGSYVMNF